MAKSIASHTWGLSTDLRMKIYSAVLVSTVLYSVPVWADGLSRECRKKSIRSLQREAHLCLQDHFRDTSRHSDGRSSSLLVKWAMAVGTSDIKPLELVIGNGRILPHIKEILDRSVSSFLTGHGNFKSRLLLMKCTNCDHCPFCGERKNVRHALMECEHYDAIRLEHGLSPTLIETSNWKLASSATLLKIQSLCNKIQNPREKIIQQQCLFC